jgi:hemerythrin-like domain-containing protein
MHDMVVVHRVFRREFRSIPELVLATQAGDVDRASVVAGHARLILSGLHLHHTSEDDLLWPLLRERAARSADIVSRMEAEHAAIDELIERLATVLGRWEAEARPAVGEEVAGLVERLGGLVIEHLDIEERSIIPLAAATITPQEWALVGKAGVAKMTRAELPLMFGAVMEDASQPERQLMLRNLPLPVRVLMRSWGAGHYRRYITQIRGRH